MNFDVVIRDGTVIDGTGSPRFAADIGISGQRIAALSRDGNLTGRRELDASGLIVAPGFIDCHSHSDWVVPLRDHDEILAPLLHQGITTMVAGNCGFSPAPVSDESVELVERGSEMLREEALTYQWHSMDEYLAFLDAQGVLINTAMLVGHGTLRYLAMGAKTTEPTPNDINQLADLAGQAIDEGAFGLSTGLGYAPGIFAPDTELRSVLRTVSERGALYATHQRSFRRVSPFYEVEAATMPHNLLSIREQLELARRTNVRLQISHLIFVGRNTWSTYPNALREIDHAADEGLDVAFDAFPYTLGNTTISINFPPWFLADQRANLQNPAALSRFESDFETSNSVIGRDWSDIYLMWGGSPQLTDLEGLNFSDIGSRLDTTPFRAYVEVAIRSDCKARILQDTFSGDRDSEDALCAVLAHPLCAFELDTILTRKGQPNPASFGAYPRILGKYARDMELFNLEEAVRRMTSFPAQRIGLTEIGEIQSGHFADLVAFDPDTVADNTTYEDFSAPPSGIEWVMISGEVVAERGALISDHRCGRVLRH
jgi:N-acyl-D-amino-acid deacylase